MRFLGDEVLSSLLLPDRKAGHAGTGCRDRMELRAITEGIAKVQDIGGSNVLVQTQSELIRILVHDLRRREDIGSIVRGRKKAQEILRERAEKRHVKLVVGIGLVEKDIEELVVGIVTKSTGETLRAYRLEIPLPLSQ